MNKCRCSTIIPHDHFIMRCRVCGNEYDVDFEPPLMCHDGDHDWEVELIESIGVKRDRPSVISSTDFSAI